MRRMRLVAAATAVAILGCSDAAGYGNDSYTDDYPDAGSGDIDCDQVDGPVAVDGSDPYGLDRDGDGIGCEPYP
jgi:hypothetical protein